MKLLIAIPAFNEAPMIGRVIASLPQKIEGFQAIDILVVNDGSFDGTAQIASKKGAIVLNHIINRGLGGAMKTIFEYARLMDYDVLVTYDADGQHQAEDIEKLITPIVKLKKDVAIGVRWNEYQNVPMVKILVNNLANVLTFLLCGIKTKDSQSGLRCFNKKAIKLINTQTDGMEVSTEFFKEIKKNNLQFEEVPIKAIYTDYSKGKGQKISDAPDVLFRLVLRLIR